MPLRSNDPSWACNYTRRSQRRNVPGAIGVKRVEFRLYLVIKYTVLGSLGQSWPKFLKFASSRESNKKVISHELFWNFHQRLSLKYRDSIRGHTYTVLFLWNLFGENTTALYQCIWYEWAQDKYRESPQDKGGQIFGRVRQTIRLAAFFHMIEDGDGETEEARKRFPDWSKS